MNIAILGAGNVGGALTKRWAEAGHDIILGVREVSAEKVQKLTGSHSNIKAKLVAEAANEADVILISLPIGAVVDVAKQCGNLSGKTIIDSTNALFQKPDPYQHASEAFKEITKCDHIVKCFNSTGFENMQDPSYKEW